jgi:hypothetical protein
MPNRFHAVFTATAETMPRVGPLRARPIEAIKAVLRGATAGGCVALFENGVLFFTVPGDSPERLLQGSRAMLADARRRWR